MEINLSIMRRNEIIYLLELLTGQNIPFIDKDISFLDNLFIDDNALSFQQLNEILLYFGYNRITLDFFKFLFNLRYNQNNSDTASKETVEEKVKLVGYSMAAEESYIISSYEEFKEIVFNYCQVALLSFGNIKYAFKTLNRYNERLEEVIDSIKDAKLSCFTDRKKSVIGQITIDPYKTFYLGNLIQKNIIDERKKQPQNEFWEEEERKMDEVTKIGIDNNNAYLASEIMDVYIATSMRNKHEFIQINEVCDYLFNKNENLKSLNLRYFNPTQAFCDDRIDKGLTEALMLKRASCTIYLVQESDTLGKNSELASTLAQGKPVIAYIPEVTDEYFKHLIDTLNKLDTNIDFNQIILKHLCIFNPSLAWGKDQIELREWLNNPQQADREELLKTFKETIANVYNRKADVLINDHPLGIQVDLNKGVANGVLVVRTLDKLAELLYAILTNDYEFDIEPENPHINGDSIKLIEKISGSVFRVMTKNQLLNNSFWNFYTKNK